MVVEEGPPGEHGPFDFVFGWRRLFPTREALEQKVGERLAWFVAPSFRATAQGWTLAFEPGDLAAMKQVLNGHAWSNWLATTCPALVVRGNESKAVDGKLLQAMAERRPNTELLSLAAGQVVHHDEAESFDTAVRRFIETLD
jgi:esterase